MEEPKKALTSSFLFHAHGSSVDLRHSTRTDEQSHFKTDHAISSTAPPLVIDRLLSVRATDPPASGSGVSNPLRTKCPSKEPGRTSRRANQLPNNRECSQRDTKPGTHLALCETKNNLEACVPRFYLGCWGGGAIVPQSDRVSFLFLFPSIRSNMKSTYMNKHTLVQSCLLMIFQLIVPLPWGGNSIKIAWRMSFNWI